jgi:hypothetical protein
VQRISVSNDGQAPRAAQRQDEAPPVKKVKSGVLRSYDDPIRSAQPVTSVTEMMTRFETVVSQCFAPDLVAAHRVLATMVRRG